MNAASQQTHRRFEKRVLRAGVVGLGKRAADDHLPALAASRRAELVAVCDSDPAQAEQVGEEVGARVYTDHDALLSGENLDFIIVAAPHAAHREIVEASLRRSVSVLKEKPFAVSLSDAREIAELSARSDATVMTTLQRRFNPIYQSFPQLAEQVGDVFYVDARYTMAIDDPHSGWRGSRATAGGGCLIDMGYHMLDLLIWYFGMPTAVAAATSCRGAEGVRYDAEDTATVLLEWADEGINGHLLVSRCIAPKAERLTATGVAGSVRLERGDLSRVARDGTVLEHLSREGAWDAAATTQVDYFCDVCLGRKPNLGAPDYHLQHAAVVEACYEAERVASYVNPRRLL